METFNFVITRGSRKCLRECQACLSRSMHRFRDVSVGHGLTDVVGFFKTTSVSTPHTGQGRVHLPGQLDVDLVILEGLVYPALIKPLFVSWLSEHISGQPSIMLFGRFCPRGQTQPTNPTSLSVRINSTGGRVIMTVTQRSTECFRNPTACFQNYWHLSIKPV